MIHTLCEKQVKDASGNTWKGKIQLMGFPTVKRLREIKQW